MASPADYSPTGWWKADSESFSDGAEANPIHDRSGSGRDFSQGTASLRPLFRTAVVNALPVFRFDGVDDVTLTSVAVSSFVTASAGTIYAFCRPKTINGTGAFTTNTANFVLRVNTSLQFGLGFRDNAGSKVAGSSNFDGVADAVEKAIAGLDRWYLLLWMHGAGLVYIGVDDLTSASLVSTASGDTNDLTNVLQLNNSTAFDGDVAEVVTFNTAHDEATRTSLQQYFGFKYRVSSLLEAQRALASRHLRLVDRPVPMVHCRRRSLIVVPDMATALRMAA